MYCMSEKGKKTAKSGEKCFFLKLVSRYMHVGYHEKGNDELYLDKDNLVLIEMTLAGFYIKLVIVFLFITYKQIKQTKFKAG